MSINKAALDQASASRRQYRADTPLSLYSIEGEDAVFIAAYLEAIEAPVMGDASARKDEGAGTLSTPPSLATLYPKLFTSHPNPDVEEFRQEALAIWQQSRESTDQPEPGGSTPPTPRMLPPATNHQPDESRVKALKDLLIRATEMTEQQLFFMCRKFNVRPQEGSEDFNTLTDGLRQAIEIIDQLRAPERESSTLYIEENCPLCKRETKVSYHKSWNRNIDCKGCGFHDYNGILGEPPLPDNTRRG